MRPESPLGSHSWLGAMPSLSFWHVIYFGSILHLPLLRQALRVPGDQPDAKGGSCMTQFGRALAELNIEILCANSSQLALSYHHKQIILERNELSEELGGQYVEFYDVPTRPQEVRWKRHTLP